jgi:FkbM family methyltransferase
MISVRSLARRLRFELVQRQNRRRRILHYAWAEVREGRRHRVILRNAEGAERQLQLRNDTSDFAVFLQIFDQLQYCTSGLSRDRDLRSRYDAILASNARPLIIDAGANIGLSAMFYRDVYPEAVIACIEPESGNFSELIKHLAGDPLIFPMHAALAGRDGNLQVVDPGYSEWGFRTQELTNEELEVVPAYGIRSVIVRAKERWRVIPFILKVDIEGYEADLFSCGDDNVLDEFYAMLIEPHDWLFPKQGGFSRVLKALASKDRDFIILNENVLSISNYEPHAL